MTWEVFYTPHTDDESIGMAGAIARAVTAGHAVLVVLVTDNEPSTRGRRIFANHADVEELRLVEWRRALEALGVTETEIWGVPERQIVHDPFAAQSEVLKRVHALHERLHPVHHHTVWGAIDVHIASGTSSISHMICANALAIFAAECSAAHVSLYGVYVYSKTLDERTAPTVRALTPDEHERKQHALNCYKGDLGMVGEVLGYGYASVPELMDAACADPHEYLIEITYQGNTP